MISASSGTRLVTGACSSMRETADFFSSFSDFVVKTEQPFKAIPYFAWANRGKGEMAVWFSRQ